MDIKWKIVEQDFANFELSNTQLRLAAGDSGDNYLCGNCEYLLAEKIPREISVRKLTNLNGITQYHDESPAAQQFPPVFHHLATAYQNNRVCDRNVNYISASSAIGVLGDTSDLFAVPMCS
jgi:hypothetical protein